MDRRREDKPHTLIVVYHGDGLEKEWRVVHPPTCPWAALRVTRRYDDHFFGPGVECEPYLIFNRSCLTQYELDGNGIDSLDVDGIDHTNDASHIDHDHVKASSFESEWHRLLPGRYTFVSWYEPGGWAGDYYDADGGMYLTSFTAEKVKS